MTELGQEAFLGQFTLQLAFSFSVLDFAGFGHVGKFGKQVALEQELVNLVIWGHFREFLLRFLGQRWCSFIGQIYSVVD